MKRLLFQFISLPFAFFILSSPLLSPLFLTYPQANTCKDDGEGLEAEVDGLVDPLGEGESPVHQQSLRE